MKKLTVKLPKELDHHMARDLIKEIDQMIQKGDIKELVLDFRMTEFMDSAGVGMILGRYKLMNALEGEVIAVHVNKQVYKLLMLSGIHKIVKIEVEEV